MSETHVLYEKRGPAAWLTLNRPEALNSLGTQLLHELDAGIARAVADGDIRAIVVTGAGRAFCAGADLKFVDALPAAERAAATASFLHLATSVVRRLELAPKPTIAAVNGLALAGGMEVILGCDLVIAAAEAKMGDGHATYGLVPGAGASARLPRKIGMTRAKYLFFTADLVSAEELRHAGLVNQVVPGAELVAAVDALIAKIATRSPLGLRRMKELADDAMEQPLDVALRAEQTVAQLHARSADYAEGLRAFNEKRKPTFEGR